MKSPREARRQRRNRLEARLQGRIPRSPGRTLDPERRLRGLADREPDIEPEAQGGFGRDLSRRLGPRGKFMVIAILIGGLITAGDLIWERVTNQTAISADPLNLAQVGLGHALYDQHCAYCHGVDLEGKPGWDGEFPDGRRPPLPLEGTGPIWRLSDHDLFDLTKYGGQVFSPPSYRNEMPGFEGQLSDADIWAILAFIKSRWSDETRARQAEATGEG